MKRPHQPCPNCQGPMRVIINAQAPPYGTLHECRACGLRLTPEARERLWVQREEERRTKRPAEVTE